MEWLLLVLSHGLPKLIWAVHGFTISNLRPVFVKRYVLYMTLICDGYDIECIQSLVSLAAQSVLVTHVRFMY